MTVPTLQWERDTGEATPVWTGRSGTVTVASAWERVGPYTGWGWCLLGRPSDANGHTPDADAARDAADAAWRTWCVSAGLVAGWRPIETVPGAVKRDRTEVLLWCKPLGCGVWGTHMAAWHPVDPAEWNGFPNLSDYPVQDGVWAEADYFEAAIHEVTHWMPLPDPPTPDKGNAP